MNKFNPFCILAVFVISACFPSGIQAQPTRCLENILPSPTSQSKTGPNLFLVLIEDTSGFVAEGEVNTSFEIIGRFVQESFSFGDRIVVTWLNKATDLGLSEAVFFDVSLDDFGAPPDLPPKLNLPTDVTLESDVPTPWTQEGEKSGTAVAESISLTNDAAKNKYYCDSIATQAAFDYLFENWRQKKTNSLERLVTNLKEGGDIGVQNFGILSATPNVIDTFELVQNYMTNECKSTKYTSCTAVYFSNLLDPHRNWALSASERNLDLKGTRLIFVVLGCAYKDGECGMVNVDWENRLKQYYNSTFAFVLAKKYSEMEIAERVTDDLISFLALP